MQLTDTMLAKSDHSRSQNRKSRSAGCRLRSIHPAQVAFPIGPAKCPQPPIEQMADPITDVTASGCDIKVRWEPPWNSVIFECARCAMNSSEDGVMIRSPVLMKYQDPIVLHAATFDGVMSALVDAALLEDHRRMAVFWGRSLANE